jgi:hypothetical protein
VAQAHVAADSELADAVWEAGAAAALRAYALAVRDARLDLDDRLPRALQ